MGLLEYIRSKDSDTKTQISLSVALGVTILIGIVWLSTFSARVSPVSLENSDDEGVRDMYEETRNLGDIIGDAKSQLGSLIHAKDELADTLTRAVTEEGVMEDVSPQDDGSALGALAPSEEYAEVIAPTSEPAKAPLPADVATTTPEGEEMTEPPVLPPEPRVILIGTTTAKTTE